jgi:PleD family two-component response regulator
MTRLNPRQKVFFAEDHPATSKLLQDILEKDFDVLAARSGEEALDLVRNNPVIDLILLDIIMPGINGFEVCRQLKADDRFSKIPIIFLTVLGEEHNEEEGFRAGGLDYIVKPISRRRLLTRVKNQLKLQQQTQLLEQKNQELKAALEQISVLTGILPICSFCKKIRDDDGSWQKLEGYIQARSTAQFSHSICPKCVKKHYSEYDTSHD